MAQGHGGPRTIEGRRVHGDPRRGRACRRHTNADRAREHGGNDALAPAVLGMATPSAGAVGRRPWAGWAESASSRADAPARVSGARRRRPPDAVGGVRVSATRARRFGRRVCGGVADRSRTPPAAAGAEVFLTAISAPPCRRRSRCRTGVGRRRPLRNRGGRVPVARRCAERPGRAGESARGCPDRGRGSGKETGRRGAHGRRRLSA